MPSISYILNLKAKGFTKTAKRAMSMINRYGFSSTEKMERNIVDFVNLVVEYDAKVTFPITGRTIEKHTDFIKSIYNERIEFTIHGYSYLIAGVIYN